MGFEADAPRQQFETADEWRAWLEANHATSAGIFAVYWRPTSGKARVGYEELVEQALCFGWVDSRGGKVDEERTMLWFTRRGRGSGWAATNKVRIERLTAAGLMHPAGQSMVDAAREDGSWTLLDSAIRLEVPDDLQAAFDNHPGSAEKFAGFSPSARRIILEWIAVAKRPATRAARVAETAARAAVGEKANQQAPEKKRS
jgi:uncharacterized protein YdeI (YjbR/CyaY-like superfamily)